jgi:hypothetical protein
MSEILKSLWIKIYAWGLPSALALGATWLFLLPQLDFNSSPMDDKKSLELFLVLSVVLAWSLSSLSTVLYRILEGYLLWPPRLQKWREQRQRALKKALQADVEEGWRGGIALEKLARYPLDDRQIAPTKFGNAIRSCERYGKTRFNMDLLTLWHELLAVAPKYIQDEIDSTRSSADFFVALLYLSGLFGLACLVLGFIENFKVSVLLLSVPAFLLTIISYWLALNAIDAWKYPMQALANLGRVKLADSLGLTLPETLEKEKAMWGLVTRYAYYARPEDGEKLNAYRKDAATSRDRDSNG